jgi:glycerol kinase
VVTETTALGAAYLAGLAVGLYPSLDSLSDVWRCERRFEPQMPAAARNRLYAGWQDAVRRSRGGAA